MPKFYPSISPHIAEWALAQPLFFTASAPLVGRHVNVSPKGYPGRTFRILDENHAAYIDTTGSGSETVSHAYEPGNGRVTIMFCSFGASPQILRFFCNASVLEWDQGPVWDDAVKRLGLTREEAGKLGARAIVFLDVWQVQTSCGYGVPLMPISKSQDGTATPSATKVNGPGTSTDTSDTSSTDSSTPTPFTDRPTMAVWADKHLQRGTLHEYQADWNAASLDGLPGLRRARRDKGERWLLLGDVKAYMRRVLFGQSDAVLAGVLLGWGTLGVAWSVFGAKGLRG